MLTAVDATSVALVVGAIGGPVVATVAIIEGGRRSRREREVTLELAKDQHSHERTLRRGDRYFEKRGEVYESLLALLWDTMRAIEFTEPLMTSAGQPTPEAPREEDWRWMVVRLGAYGSPEVEAALEHFLSKVRGFNTYVETLHSIQRQRGELGETRAEIGKYREEARAARAEVQSLVRADLAEL